MSDEIKAYSIYSITTPPVESFSTLNFLWENGLLKEIRDDKSNKKNERLVRPTFRKPTH